MTNIIQQNQKLKEVLGAFVLAFSEMEYGLAILSSFTDSDLLNQETNLKNKYLGYTLSEKRRSVSKFIKSNLPDLEKYWKDINDEIGILNRDRRFLVHGVIENYLSDSIYTYLKDKKAEFLTEKEYKITDIEILNGRLYDLISGKFGVCGHFQTMFITARVNLWNKSVPEEQKRAYKENG